MSVVSSSSVKTSAAAVKKATELIAEAMALLGGAPLKARSGKKTAAEKTKGTNRGLVKLGLQRQAALLILVEEWEALGDEARAEMQTVTKVSKAGKETVKEVPVHPKPTYKDVITLFKKGARVLPDVEDAAVEGAWAAAQAKRELELSVASEVSDAEPAAGGAGGSESEAAKATPAKKTTAKPATPAAPAAPKKEAKAAKPAAKAEKPAPAAALAKKPAASSEKKIAEIENDDGVTCTVFEFKKKNYIRYPTGHCWNAKKDGDDWGFGEWAGMWMGNSIDASVAEPECEDEEEEDDE